MGRWWWVCLVVAGCGLETSALAPPEEGVADASVGDGAAEGGPTDARVDSRVAADGSMDAGPTDGGTPDGAAPDGAMMDGGVADTAPPDTRPPDATPACPSGYDRSLGASRSCYRIVSTTRTWQDAERDCESDGAHLIVVNDSVEDDFVPDYHWMGFSETVTDGDWRWVTGSRNSGYLGWAGGEPAYGGAACAVQRPDGWHDDNDYESKAYVCEHDGDAADAAAWE